jgi:3-oxoacyl-[acyl-carrier protein] reductase
MTNSRRRFESRVALVTGAGSGIGAAIARRFTAEGATVAFVDIDREAAEAALVAAGGRGSSYGCDVSDSSVVTATMDAVVATHGGIDVVVNCAGISGTRAEVDRRSLAMQAYTTELLETRAAPRTPVDITVNTSDEDWRRMFAVHVDGTFYVTRSALRWMLPARSGSIVNISSICGLMGCIGTPSYSAAKAAVIGFTKSVAKEVANQGVRVNVVAPGFIDTDLTPNRSSAERALTTAQIPAGHLGSVGEVAEAVLYLASDDASYYTGAVHAPDGGVTM